MDNYKDISGNMLGAIWDYLANYTDNVTDDECCPPGDVCDPSNNQKFEATFVVGLYSLVFAVGILGNGVLLGVLVQRRTWSVTDTFILHLAVADVLLLVTLPLWAMQSAWDEGWTFGTPLCKITGAVFMINFYSGIFLLGCISLDRYLSIVHATQMYSRRKPWAVHMSCMVVWLFSLLLSITDFVFLEAVTDKRRQDKTKCVRNYFEVVSLAEDFTEAPYPSQSKWKLASRLTYHLVGFLLPSAVMIFCYSGILRRLRCGSQGHQKQRATRVIIAVVVVFFLCWAPYNITLMVDTLQSPSGNVPCGMKTALEKAMTVTASVGYLHCSLNPILYAFVGVKFRRQLVQILRSLGCRLKTTSRVHSVTSSRRTSTWSESGETSNSLAI